tara:strand:+ start:3653 stop:4000 length:348 start_codon:yes stop_codon:yes gene_type:complete
MGLAKELRKRNKQERREVLVPEWSDDDGAFKLYCYPISCYDLDMMQKRHKNFLNDMTVAAMVDLIIMKAKDESGDKLFQSAEDRLDLMGEETSVISNIANQMFADVVSVEEHEGN